MSWHDCSTHRPNSPRGWLLAAAGATLLVSGGAGCPRMLDQYTLGPRVLPESPPLDDVLAVVNDNTARVQTLYAVDAKIKSGRFPALRSSLALERPNRLRMQAGMLSGTELDVGSNDELFWFWVKRGQPPALYYCRHAEFAQSPARQAMPLEPQWLVEALGLASFPPQGQHEGPQPVGDGRLEIRSRIPGPHGDVFKITRVGERTGWVLEQHVYDARGERLASAIATQHRRDPATGVTLPRHVEIQCPAQDLTLTVDLGDVQINTPLADRPQLWTKPIYPGWVDIDLGRTSAQQVSGMRMEPVRIERANATDAYPPGP